MSTGRHLVQGPARGRGRALPAFGRHPGGAGVAAAGAAVAQLLAERTAVVCQVSPYRPGEFCRRELPPLRAVLAGVGGLGLLVAGGYADLGPAGPAWARRRTASSACR